jgi:hypothetical protein
VIEASGAFGQVPRPQPQLQTLGVVLIATKHCQIDYQQFANWAPASVIDTRMQRQVQPRSKFGKHRFIRHAQLQPLVESKKWFRKSESQLSELLRRRLSLFCYYTRKMSTLSEALPVDDQAVLVGNYDPYGLSVQFINFARQNREMC